MSDVRTKRLVDAVFGAPLGKRESKSATDDLSRRFIESVERRHALHTTRQAAVGPLLEKIVSEHSEEVAKARVALEKLARSARKLPAVAAPRIEPSLFSGSIVAIAAPPYDWGDAHASSDAEAWGDASLGEIHFKYQSISGGGDPTFADGEVGKWFVPTSGGVVRFRTTVTFAFDWEDSACFYTAHSHAFVGAYIYEHTSQGAMNLLVDNRVPLWSDGAAWLDDHSDSQYGLSQLFDLPFLASVGSAYFLGVWCGCAADSAGGFGGFSYATGEFTGRVPVIVVKV